MQITEEQVIMGSLGQLMYYVVLYMQITEEQVIMGSLGQLMYCVVLYADY